MTFGGAEAAGQQYSPILNSEYSFLQTSSDSNIIGEGTFGCVRVGINRKTQEHVAIKAIPKSLASGEAVEKEFLLHKAVSSHLHVIRMHCKLEDDSFYYLIMELAAGGELFDRIEPEMGFGDQDLAHAYFCQLVAAVRHIHTKGIIHRDLKPENVLLDESGRLKLTDFGVATLFHYKGTRRKIQVKCGSELYMAPQVFSNAVPFEGDKADIWSLGVILWVMIHGSLPWEKPDPTLCPQYAHYLQVGPKAFLGRRPNFSLDSNSLASLTDLLARCLDPVEENRISLDGILEHSWFKRSNPLICPLTCSLNIPALMEALSKPVCSRSDSTATTSKSYSSNSNNNNNNIAECGLLPLSQPEKFAFSSFSQAIIKQQTEQQFNNLNDSKTFANDRISMDYLGAIFSQPTAQLPLFSCSQQAMMMASQEEIQQFASANGNLSFPVAYLRLTRFSVQGMALVQIMERFLELMDAFLVQAKVLSGGNSISFQTVDSRKCILTGQVIVSLFGAQGQHLVIFRKSRGDSIEFKRPFYALYEGFCHSE